MDGSLSQFMATLQRRKARKEKNNGKFNKKPLSYNPDGNRPDYNFPDITDKELELVKNKLKSQNTTNATISSIAFIILVVVIYLLIT